jgi:hypothetical protein
MCGVTCYLDAVLPDITTVFPYVAAGRLIDDRRFAAFTVFLLDATASFCT